MSRKLVIDDEQGHREIEYSSLSLRELNHRIKEYESKYGSSLARFQKNHSCAEIAPDEITDLMDWELLTDEKALRMKTPKTENSF